MDFLNFFPVLWSNIYWVSTLDLELCLTMWQMKSLMGDSAVEACRPQLEKHYDGENRLINGLLQGCMSSARAYEEET